MKTVVRTVRGTDQQRGWETGGRNSGDPMTARTLLVAPPVTQTLPRRATRTARDILALV